MNRNLYLALLLVLALCIAMIGCSKPPLTYDEQISLGNKYLSEGNYKEAILAFEAAIKIDPKSIPAYLGIADAYIALGDTESAVAILQEGIDLTQSEELMLKIDEINMTIHTTEVLSNASTEVPTEVTEEEDIQVKGRSPQSNCVVYDNRIYFKSIIDQGLYSTDMIGMDKKVITTNPVGGFDISNDYIYFANGAADWKLTRIKIDGSEEKVISKDTPAYIIAYDNWVYYLNYIEYAHTQFVRIGNDGSNREIIYDNLVQDWLTYYLYDNAIYYYSMSEDPQSGTKKGITKISITDLQDRENIYSDNLNDRDLSFSNEGIYMTEISFNTLGTFDDTIIKWDYEFKNREVIKPMTGDLMNFYFGENKLAYTGENRDIYLMDMDSCTTKKLTNNGKSDSTSVVNIVGEWLYYYHFNLQNDVGGDIPLDGFFRLNLSTGEIIQIE